MGLYDIKPFASYLGGTVSIRWAPMKASETFLPGEPILVDSNGLAATAIRDGTEMILADGVAGISINGPGLATATAELPATQGWGRLYKHPDTGENYATNDKIWFYPFDENNYFVANKMVTAGGATLATAPTGADRGDRFQITYVSATTPDGGWGIERTAATIGTDYVAEIVDVLDSVGKSVTASGTGTTIVFRVLS